MVEKRVSQLQVVLVVKDNGMLVNLKKWNNL